MPPVFNISNIDLPQKLKTSIIAKISKRVVQAYQSKPLICGICVWVRNNLETLMIDQDITNQFVMNQNVVVHSFGKPVIPVYNAPANQLMMVFPDAKTKLIGFLPTKALVPVLAFQVEQANLDLSKLVLKDRNRKIITLNSQMVMSDVPDRVICFEFKEEAQAPSPVAPPVQAPVAATPTGVIPNETQIAAVPQSDSESDSTEHESSESSGQEEEPEKSSAQPNTTATNTAHRGTQLKCVNLRISNVAIIEVYQLKLVVSCERCKQHVDVDLNANMKFTSACTKCTNSFGLLWRPEMFGEHSDIMGYIDKEGVSIFDVLPSCYQLTCFGCSGTSQQKNVACGMSFFQFNCLDCHKALQFTIERIQFIRIKKEAPAGVEFRKKTRVAKKDEQEIQIQRGKPLPDQGTCRHYKKSKRWLRFPCCQKLYPCETCHNDVSDHEAEWARKMVCGFCACEQTTTVTCKSCGGDVTGMRHTSHWEGGEGQRDPSKMSKNDNKKYAGLNKTKPRGHK